MTVEEKVMTVAEIEQAAQKLPVSELDGLVNRLSDLFHARWDKEIEDDLEAGRFDALISQLEQDYDRGLTKPL